MNELERFVASHAPPRPLPAVNGLVSGLQAHGVEALVPLWEATEVYVGREGLDPPFWAVPWAGGLGLAWHLERHPELVVGKRVIDFACGGGLVGLVAARLGAASVALAEIDPFARAACRLNAALNGLNVTVVEEDLLVSPLTEADVVLAGDVFYAAAMSAMVLPWLRAHAAAGRLVLVGDPGRNYLPSAGLVALSEVVVPVSRDWEDGLTKRTRILRLEAAP